MIDPDALILSRFPWLKIAATGVVSLKPAAGNLEVPEPETSEKTLCILQGFIGLWACMDVAFCVDGCVFLM